MSPRLPYGAAAVVLTAAAMGTTPSWLEPQALGARPDPGPWPCPRNPAHGRTRDRYCPKCHARVQKHRGTLIEALCALTYPDLDPAEHRPSWKRMPCSHPVWQLRMGGYYRDYCGQASVPQERSVPALLHIEDDEEAMLATVEHLRVTGGVP